MANITIQFADGEPHSYENVPDTVTPEQIEQRAMKDFPDRKVSHIARTGFSETKTQTGDLSDQIPDVPPQPKPYVEPSMSDKFFAGAEALVGTAEQMVEGAIAAPVALVKDIYKRTTGQAEAGVSHAEDYMMEDVQKQSRLQPQTDLGKEYQQKLSETLSSVPAILPEAGLIKNSKATSGYGVKQAGALAKEGVKDKIIPKVSQDAVALAKKAQEKGIQIPYHALLADSKYVKSVGDFLDSMPFSGSTQKKNAIAFNKNIIGQIGGDVKEEALTDRVLNDALTKSGDTIGNIMNRVQIPIESMEGELVALKNEMKGHTGDTEKVINGQIEKVQDLAKKNNGVIPGAALQELDSQVGARIRAETDPNIRSQLLEFQDILRESAKGQIKDPNVIAQLQDARTKYAKGMTVAPLVAKGDLHGISPTQLINRINSSAQGKRLMARGNAGEMGDMAKIAQNFMKEQKGSLTAEKSFLMGAISEASGFGKLLAGVTVGQVYNRFGPKLASAIINRSQESKVNHVQMDHPTLDMFKKAAADDLAAAKQRAHEANMKVLQEAGAARGQQMVASAQARRLEKELGRSSEARAQREAGEARGNISVAEAEQKAAARAAGKAAEARALMEAGEIRGQQMVVSDEARRIAKEVGKQTEAQIMAEAGVARGEEMIKEAQRQERQKELAKRQREMAALMRQATGVK